MSDKNSLLAQVSQLPQALPDTPDYPDPEEVPVLEDANGAVIDHLIKQVFQSVGPKPQVAAPVQNQEQMGPPAPMVPPSPTPAPARAAAPVPAPMAPAQTPAPVEAQKALVTAPAASTPEQAGPPAPEPSPEPAPAASQAASQAEPAQEAEQRIAASRFKQYLEMLKQSEPESTTPDQGFGNLTPELVADLQKRGYSPTTINHALSLAVMAFNNPQEAQELMHHDEQLAAQARTDLTNLVHQETLLDREGVRAKAREHSGDVRAAAQMAIGDARNEQTSEAKEYAAALSTLMQANRAGAGIAFDPHQLHDPDYRAQKIEEAAAVGEQLKTKQTIAKLIPSYKPSSGVAPDAVLYAAGITPEMIAADPSLKSAKDAMDAGFKNWQHVQAAKAQMLSDRAAQQSAWQKARLEHYQQLQTKSSIKELTSEEGLLNNQYRTAEMEARKAVSAVNTARTLAQLAQVDPESDPNVIKAEFAAQNAEDKRDHVGALLEDTTNRVHEANIKQYGGTAPPDPGEAMHQALNSAVQRVLGTQEGMQVTDPIQTPEMLRWYQGTGYKPSKNNRPTGAQRVIALEKAMNAGDQVAAHLLSMIMDDTKSQLRDMRPGDDFKKALQQALMEASMGGSAPAPAAPQKAQ